MVTGKYFAAERINPLELIERPDVSLLVEEIFNNYKPSGKKIMLILPCSAQKPYGESRSQRLYWEAAREVVKQEDVLERATLSGVYGIVPASFEKRVMDYDFNLNRSCFTRGKHYEIMDILSIRVYQFLLRFGKEFDLIISYGRERYRQVMELAISNLKRSGQLDIRCAILPSKGKTLRKTGLLELKQVLLDNASIWHMDEVCRIHTVEFERVQGHAGNNYNKRADRLARAAIPRGE